MNREILNVQMNRINVEMIFDKVFHIHYEFVLFDDDQLL
jgi:hypothetical protein